VIVNAVPVHGRHRLDGHGQRYWRVHPPKHYRSTSHRRSRRVVLQRPVAELVQWPYAQTRRPWWERAGRVAAGWLAEPSR
jgi:hypothetical protein